MVNEHKALSLLFILTQFSLSQIVELTLLVYIRTIVGLLFHLLVYSSEVFEQNVSFD